MGYHLWRPAISLATCLLPVSFISKNKVTMHRISSHLKFTYKSHSTLSATTDTNAPPAPYLSVSVPAVMKVGEQPRTARPCPPQATLASPALPHGCTGSRSQGRCLAHRSPPPALPWAVWESLRLSPRFLEGKVFSFIPSM